MSKTAISEVASALRKDVFLKKAMVCFLVEPFTFKRPENHAGNACMPRPKKTIHFKIKMYGRKGPGTTINWAL